MFLMSQRSDFIKGSLLVHSLVLGDILLLLVGLKSYS